jgi:acetyl esterase/lipase
MSWNQPFVLEVPDAARERHGHTDLYLPDAAGPHAAVVFVHGGPIPSDDSQPSPREWPVFRGYGNLAASVGLVGVTADLRMYGAPGFPDAAQDLADAVDLARADPRVDADRIALWHFSGGGLLLADWLREPPAWLRCLAATYPLLDVPAEFGVDPRLRPIQAVHGAVGLPFVLTRVGRERPELAEALERFVVAAEDAGVQLEIVDVPHGQHAFDMFDHTDESRDAVRRAMAAVVARLS